MEVVQVCNSRIVIQHEVFSQTSFLWVSKSVFPINVPISDISVALVSSGTSSASATALIFQSLFQSFYSLGRHLQLCISSMVHGFLFKRPSKAAAVRLMRLGYDSALSEAVSNQAKEPPYWVNDRPASLNEKMWLDDLAMGCQGGLI